MTDLPTLHRPTAWKWYPLQGDRLNLSILEWKYWQGLDTETNPIGNNRPLIRPLTSFWSSSFSLSNPSKSSVLSIFLVVARALERDSNMQRTWYHCFIIPPSSLNGLETNLPIRLEFFSICCLHVLHLALPCAAYSTTKGFSSAEAIAMMCKNRLWFWAKPCLRSLMLTLVIANIDNIHSFYPLFLQCCRKLKASSNLCVNNKSIAHDPPFCFEYGEMHPGNLGFQSPLTNQVLLHKKSKWTICLAISLHLVI